MNKHTFSPVVDTLYAYQEKKVTQYPCYCCDEFTPTPDLHDREIVDQGERNLVQICDLCIARGWHPNWHK